MHRNSTFYHPQRSCGKVMFSQASVILFTGGLVYASINGGRHPPRQTAPGQTPPGQTPPMGGHPHGHFSDDMHQSVCQPKYFWSVEYGPSSRYKAIIAAVLLLFYLVSVVNVSFCVFIVCDNLFKQTRY